MDAKLHSESLSPESHCVRIYRDRSKLRLERSKWSRPLQNKTLIAYNTVALVCVENVGVIAVCAADTIRPWLYLTTASPA